MAGKVWLVGAGPGDVGLLTKKGYDVLSTAEVVVYDSLVSDGILALMPDSAEKICAGKRAGNHILRQEETNQLLLEKAKEGRRVVRLKGGDPFLFGRGGEELELLCQEKIEFEVVPGITSAIAVPSYNGIPVTHRDYCSSIHIITGHKKKDEKYDIDFDALVRTKGTLIFLMGVAALKDICDGLIKAGMDKNMPAAVLQEGTTAGQRKLVATVSSLFEEARKAQIGTPGIIVIGRVCTLSEEYDWYGKLPLFGAKILVTRPRELASTMAVALRKLGAEVVELPAIRTEAIVDNKALLQALKNIGRYSWLAFTSPTGVRVFFEEMNRNQLDVRSLGSIKVAALGSGTASELRKHGIIADLIPFKYDGRSLGEEIARVAEKGDRILIPRAEQGNKEILEALGEYEVEDVATYRTIGCSQDYIDIAGEIESGKISCVAFTSSSSVRAFVEANRSIDYSMLKAVCIGKQTYDRAKTYGFSCSMAGEASIDSLIEKIIETYTKEGK